MHQIKGCICLVLRLRKDRRSALLGDDARVADVLVFDLRQPGHHVLVTELAECIIAYVTETCVPVLRFIFITLDSQADTPGNIGLENVQTVLTSMNFDEEAASSIPDMQEALLDLHLAPPLIQLVEGDDVLQPRNIENTGELDCLPRFASELHDPATLDWNKGVVAKPHGPLYRTIEVQESFFYPGLVTRATDVKVPPFNVLVVTAGAEEDMSPWLVEMQTALRWRRGVECDLAHMRHQQGFLILLMGEIGLILLQRAAILCPISLLAAVVAGITVVLPATILLPPLTLKPAFGSAFARPRLGAAFTGLLLLHMRLPLLLCEHELATIRR
jgi:hypothetical protein